MERDEKHTKWECKKCTYKNAGGTKCSMCSYKKFAVEIFSLSPGTPIKSSSDDLCDVYKEERLCNTSNLMNFDHSLIDKVKKLELKSPSSDLGFESVTASSSHASKLDPVDANQKWQCLACTYENYPKASKCVMCATKRDVVNNQKIISNEKDFTDNDYDDENLASNYCGASNFNVAPTLDDSTVKNNLKNLPHNNNKHQTNTNELEMHQERLIRQLKRQADWIWLNAVNGVIENDLTAVELFLERANGNVARALSSNDVILLNRPSISSGQTLIHLAIRFHRDELLSRLLAQISTNGIDECSSGIKCVGECVAPEIAEQIRKRFGGCLRIRKPFGCSYVNEHATFSLPAEISILPLEIQEMVWAQLLDSDAQKQLENPPPAINWNLEITSRLGSRLMVLWNRSAGDCLLDSAMQATWGVFDKDNILRKALFDSMQSSPLFYTRWKEYEMAYHQASLLHFTLEEHQWDQDWKNLIALAGQKGGSLEQIHIFVLCHIFRRPIIVYGVKYVKSYRGDAISPARFEGLYLPLLFEQSFCIKSPLALGYTRGHFSALVPKLDISREEDVTFLPLQSCDSKLIPIHFLSQAEMGHEEKMMRNWLDTCLTEGGLMVAQQKLHKKQILVEQLWEKWLNYYRRKAQIISPMIRGPQMIDLEGYLSDGDTDEE